MYMHSIGSIKGYHNQFQLIYHISGNLRQVLNFENNVYKKDRPLRPLHLVRSEAFLDKREDCATHLYSQMHHLERVICLPIDQHKLHFFCLPLPFSSQNLKLISTWIFVPQLQ